MDNVGELFSRAILSTNRPPTDPRTPGASHVPRAERQPSSQPRSGKGVCFALFCNHSGTCHQSISPSTFANSPIFVKFNSRGSAASSRPRSRPRRGTFEQMPRVCQGYASSFFACFDIFPMSCRPGSRHIEHVDCDLRFAGVGAPEG